MPDLRLAKARQTLPTDYVYDPPKPPLAFRASGSQWHCGVCGMPALVESNVVRAACDCGSLVSPRFSVDSSDSDLVAFDSRRAIRQLVDAPSDLEPPIDMHAPDPDTDLWGV